MIGVMVSTLVVMSLLGATVLGTMAYDLNGKALGPQAYPHVKYCMAGMLGITVSMLLLVVIAGCLSA